MTDWWPWIVSTTDRHWETSWWWNCHLWYWVQLENSLQPKM